jgi:hypothetical protein
MVDTVTSTTPVPAGLVAVSEFALTKFVEVAAAEPKRTVEPEVNPVPVTVTTVAP